MKSYLLLVHLLLSLPSKAADEKIPLLQSSSGLGQSQFVNDAEESGPDEGLGQGHATSPAMIRGRQSANIPIPEQQAYSPQLEDYFDSPPKTTPKANVPRRALFEPHMRRIEEDFIRQLTFKIRVRKHTTEDNCIKITIEGFLRDKRMMKQTVDVEY